MKVKNLDIVRFFNASEKILKKKMPRKLYSAIDLNLRNLESAAKTYDAQRSEIYGDSEELDEEGVKALDELLNIEIEAVVQKITESDLEAMDASGRFDAFTGEEYRILNFMISTE